MVRLCWEWYVDPECRDWILFGACPECGDLISAVMPSSDFVGMAEMSCRRVNDVGDVVHPFGRVPDGCGWKSQVFVDVPNRKAYFVWEVCSR